MQKRGFTLAEVLITLAVIGVVAAMSIPSLIASTNNAEYATGLKKVYSTLNNAMQLLMTETSCVGSINCTMAFNAIDQDTVFNNISPYFNITKSCGTSTDQHCFADSHVDLSGNSITTEFNANNGYAKFVLADGMSVAVQGFGGCFATGGTGVMEVACGAFEVDINGPKKPNKVGRDTFLFYVTESGVVYPEGGVDLEPTYWKTTANAHNICDPTTVGAKGYSCAGRVLEAGEMDY